MAGAGLSAVMERFSGMLPGGGETAVGLSIGSSSIKLVELKKAGKVWKLLHFGIVQLPEDAIVNREIANPIVVVDSIKTLTNQIKLRTKNVCTAHPCNAAMIKRMHLEVPKLSELQDTVFWEAEQYLPFEVSDVVMDYQMLSRAKDAKTDVLLVAAKKGVLDSYMGCVNDAGLKPRTVDLDFFALQNLFEANYAQNPQEAVALVDIGASALKVVVLSGGIPVYTKDSAMGGRNITASIQGQLGLSYADAEVMKTSGQANGIPQEVSELMHNMAENFAIEIKRSLDYYNASSTGAPVSYVLLAGGSAKLPGLAKIIEDHAQLPTQLLNPFNSLSYDPSVFTQEYVAAIAPIAAVPIGLALRAGAR
jgi:type IV pilus assembly protein PilM